MSRYERQEDTQTREYAMRIMEALSGVDQELLEKSGRTSPGNRVGRPLWKLAGTWAAVLVLMAAGAAGWQGYRMMQRAENDGTGSGTASQNGCESMELIQEGREDSPEAVPENEMLPVPDKNEDGGTPGENQEAQSADALPAPTGVPESDTFREDAPMEDGGGDTAVEELPDTAQPEQEKALGCMKQNFVSYTEAEAREQEELGQYLPDRLPAGYVFSEAGSNPDSEKQNLTVCWNRGTDSIWLYLEKEDGDMVTVDREKPESYDVRLYEIPFDRTVPGEYRESFDNPVFALADFDLEAVESRMYLAPDQEGDAVSRGNFRVLYPGNVVVSFSGRGTAEEIWEMFCSIGQ